MNPVVAESSRSRSTRAGARMPITMAGARRCRVVPAGFRVQLEERHHRPVPRAPRRRRSHPARRRGRARKDPFDALIDPRSTNPTWRCGSGSCSPTTTRRPPTSSSRITAPSGSPTPGPRQSALRRGRRPTCSATGPRPRGHADRGGGAQAQRAAGDILVYPTGYLREGAWADVVVFDPEPSLRVRLDACATSRRLGALTRMLLWHPTHPRERHGGAGRRCPTSRRRTRGQSSVPTDDEHRQEHAMTPSSRPPAGRARFHRGGYPRVQGIPYGASTAVRIASCPRSRRRRGPAAGRHQLRRIVRAALRRRDRRTAVDTSAPRSSPCTASRCARSCRARTASCSTCDPGTR